MSHDQMGPLERFGRRVQPFRPFRFISCGHGQTKPRPTELAGDQRLARLITTDISQRAPKMGNRLTLKSM